MSLPYWVSPWFWATSMAMKYDAPGTSYFWVPSFTGSCLLHLLRPSSSSHLWSLESFTQSCFTSTIIAFSTAPHFLTTTASSSYSLFPLAPFYNLIEISIPLTYKFLIYFPFPASLASPFSLRQVMCHLEESPYLLCPLVLPLQPLIPILSYSRYLPSWLLPTWITALSEKNHNTPGTVASVGAPGIACNPSTNSYPGSLL